MPESPVSSAEEGYLLLADISGYTGFMGGVGDAHGFDYTDGIPPGYELMGALLDSVAGGLQSPFSVAKFEGDAVFAVAAASELDGRGSDLVGILRGTYRRFVDARTEADPARNAHECVACALVGNLDLKMVLHEGPYVSQAVHGQTELLGPMRALPTSSRTTLAISRAVSWTSRRRRRVAGGPRARRLAARPALLDGDRRLNR